MLTLASPLQPRSLNFNLSIVTIADWVFWEADSQVVISVQECTGGALPIRACGGREGSMRRGEKEHAPWKESMRRGKSWAEERQAARKAGQ